MFWWIYGRKSWLSRSSNPLNGQPIFSTETARNQKRSWRRRVINYMHLSLQLPPKVSIEDTKVSSWIMWKRYMTHRMSKTLLLKNYAISSAARKIVMAPEPSKFVENQTKSSLKRIRSSPDEEGLQSLKNCRENGINGRGTVNWCPCSQFSIIMEIWFETQTSPHLKLILPTIWLQLLLQISELCVFQVFSACNEDRNFETFWNISHFLHEDTFP